jgi:hypothetical protein
VSISCFDEISLKKSCSFSCCNSVSSFSLNIQILIVARRYKESLLLLKKWLKLRIEFHISSNSTSLTIHKLLCLKELEYLSPFFSSKSSFTFVKWWLGHNVSSNGTKSFSLLSTWRPKVRTKLKLSFSP